MKRFLAILAAFAILALAGCKPQTDLDDPGESRSEDSAPVEHSGEPTLLYGLSGDVIYTDEIAGEYTEDFTTLVGEGFIYLSEPSGLCFNDRDNADNYNSAEMSFEGIPEDKYKDYIRVNVGESFGGLTLKSATTTFNNPAGRVFYMPDGTTVPYLEAGFPEIYFTGGECEFDGQLTLEGYACAVTSYDIYGTSVGDIIFVPSEGCGLPVMSYSLDRTRGICREFRTGANFGMVWCNEYGSICLGNAETAAADISCLPSNGEFVKVSVTIDKITMRSGVELGDFVYAEIVEIHTV